MTEQEAFEAWASDNGKWPGAIAKKDGEYLRIQTENFWLAWQAGIKWKTNTPEVFVIHQD